MYSESGHFTSNNKVYSLHDVFNIVRAFPVLSWNINNLIWVISYDIPRENRVNKADLQYPIIITKDEGRLLVVDGLHRLTKASRQKRVIIKGKYISPELLEKTKIN